MYISIYLCFLYVFFVVYQCALVLNIYLRSMLLKDWKYVQSMHANIVLVLFKSDLFPSILKSSSVIHRIAPILAR